MCALVQLSYVVNPNLMFRNYVYRSSSSESIPRHFSEFARYVHSNYLLSSKNLIVEVGSNDGTLLSAFKQLGCKVLGVDPAENLARVAKARGVETIPEFFNAKVAQKILEKSGPARVVIGTNVFAHIDDLHDFMDGVTALLQDEGILSIEVPYLGDLNQNVEYDTIYHEHLSYFSIQPIERLFSAHGMQLESVARLQVHGGSIRVIGKKTNRKSKRHALIELEKRSGLDKLETYRTLAYRVEYQKEYLKHMLEAIKSKGQRIIGYGAPAKGNTMLNVCDIGTETLDYLIDTTPEKIGKFTPGKHVPIFETAKFRRERPPYALMLAWNYQEEILMKERDYIGQFINPIPYPRVLSRIA